MIKKKIRILIIVTFVLAIICVAFGERTPMAGGPDYKALYEQSERERAALMEYCGKCMLECSEPIKVGV